jgi:hypothetical protein
MTCTPTMTATGASLVGVLFAMALDMPAVNESDAIAVIKAVFIQGGLLASNLTLLWMYHRTFVARLEAKDQEVVKKDERLSVLVDMVTRSATAAESSAVASRDLAEMVKELRDTIHHWDERRTAQDRRNE